MRSYLLFANPHNDVALLEQALRSLGFEVVTMQDAGLGAPTRALNGYARRLRDAGPSAVGFFYYSGHGASDGATIDRYPNGEFAAIARALAEHFDRKLRAEQAAQEKEHKRIEEERKAAEVKRLEEERRVPEAAIEEERKRAAEGKASEEARRLQEQQRAELVARTEVLREAAEDARLAREAAKFAEEQRVAAIKAAEEATRVANVAITLKRDADSHSDPAKIAASLPKSDRPKGVFDGVWTIHRIGPSCPAPDVTFQVFIRNSAAGGQWGGGRIRGSVSKILSGAEDGRGDGRQPAA